METYTRILGMILVTITVTFSTLFFAKELGVIIRNRAKGGES